MLYALWAASSLGGLGQSLAGAAGALLAGDVGGAVAVAGLPQASLVVGAAVSALALSRLTVRRGRGAALSTGAVVATSGCLVVAAAALLASLWLVLLGSLLLGAGTTAVMLGRYAAADLGPETSRARSMASVLVATTVGRSPVQICWARRAASLTLWGCLPWLGRTSSRRSASPRQRRSWPSASGPAQCRSQGRRRWPGSSRLPPPMTR